MQRYDVWKYLPNFCLKSEYIAKIVEIEEDLSVCTYKILAKQNNHLKTENHSTEGVRNAQINLAFRSLIRIFELDSKILAFSDLKVQSVALQSEMPK